MHWKSFENVWASTFLYPRHELRTWRRSSGDTEQLFEEKIGPVWLLQRGRLAWKGAEEILQLPTFDHVLNLVESDEPLRRRIFAVYGATGYDFSRVSGYLYLLLQDCVLAPLVDSQRSFEFDEEQLSLAYNAVDQALASVVITSKSIISLNNTWLPNGELRLNAETTLRRLDDSELSNAILFGLIRPRYAGRNSVYVTDKSQFGLCHEIVTKIDDPAIEGPDFDRILKRAISPKIPAEQAIRLVAALNLYCSKGAAGINGSLTGVKLRLNGIYGAADDIGSSSSQSGRGCATLAGRDFSEFENLFKKISMKSVWKRLAVPLERFSRAAARTSDGESIVDLAIAAEALFGGDAVAEATIGYLFNAALFLGSNDWPPSEIRSFFRDVYSRRSAIVHGTSKAPDMGINDEEVRKKLEFAMRLALHKATDELSQNAQSLEWGKLLDSALNQIKAGPLSLDGK